MKDTIFVVVLVALVVFSAFQTVEIQALKDTGTGASVTGDVVANEKPVKSSDAGNFDLSNLQNTRMVGGC